MAGNAGGVDPGHKNPDGTTTFSSEDQKGGARPYSARTPSALPFTGIVHDGTEKMAVGEPQAGLPAGYGWSVLSPTNPNEGLVLREGMRLTFTPAPGVEVAGKVGRSVVGGHVVILADTGLEYAVPVGGTVTITAFAP